MDRKGGVMEEKEIDFIKIFIDCLKIIKKRFRLVVGFTAVCAVIAIIYSFTFLPVTYESTAIIEPAKINNVAVETVQIAEFFFKNPLNPYLKEIASELGMKEKEAYALSFRFKIMDKLGYMQIIGKGSTPEEAKKLTDILISMILKRQEKLAKNALEISENEMTNLKEQFLSVKAELEKIDKTLYQKESASTQGQGYVFQGLIQLKENALKRQLDLEARIKSKEMDMKYFTKTASVVAEPTLPILKSGPSKLITAINYTFSGLFLALVLAFIIEFFKKYPI
ncbi:MAG: Wzz/FepE/Etk N-terminal domain-containing protein [Elusimicrobia bacterium]|nr:Wzz/FepE/Etk N-terminal domain-containing protein [Elusimicrobiota bacterium]